MKYCDKCGARQTKFQKKFGISVEALAIRFKVSRMTIYNRAADGSLAEYIKTGRMPRQVNRSLYRGRYKLTLKEIAKLLGVSPMQVSILHHSGKLEEIIEKRKN